MRELKQIQLGSEWGRTPLVRDGGDCGVGD